MKTKRLLSMLLICTLLVLSLAGCKKKDKVVEDETPTATEAPATPTPVPVTVKELIDKTGAELKTVFTKTGTEGNETYSANIPDGKIKADGQVAMKLNLLGLAKFDINMNLSGNFASKSNLGEGDAHIEMSMTSSSMFSDEKQTDTENSNVKFYFDNTNGEEITVYSNEDDSVWTKSTQSLQDFVEQYTKMLESYNVDVENQKTNELFKNSDQFTADKTKLTETADGYNVTTSFTWEEFYNAFKDDLTKVSSEVAGSVASALSGSINVDEAVKGLYENGTGKFTTTADFDKEKNLKNITVKVENFSLSTEIKEDGEDGLPLSLNIANLALTIAIDRDGSISVTIPEDVRTNATEAAKGVEDDNGWDITDPEDIIGGDDDNTDTGLTGDGGDLPEEITFVQDGVYYLLVGGQTVSLPFPAEWKPEAMDPYIFVEPDENLQASYTDSSVSILENGISDDLRSFVQFYEEEYAATDFTVTFNGMTQPSYVLVIDDEDTPYKYVILLQYVPGAANYLMVEIADWTQAADPMDLIQKFGISF